MSRIWEGWRCGRARDLVGLLLVEAERALAAMVREVRVPGLAGAVRLRCEDVAHEVHVLELVAHVDDRQWMVARYLYGVILTSSMSGLEQQIVGELVAELRRQVVEVQQGVLPEAHRALNAP